MKKLCMMVVMLMTLSSINAQNTTSSEVIEQYKDTLQVVDILDEFPQEVVRNEYLSDHFNNFGDGLLADQGGKRVRKVKFLQINIIKKTLLYLNPSRDPEDHRDNRGNKQIEFIYIDEVDQKVKSYLLRPTGYVAGEEKTMRFFDNTLFILQFNNPRLWEEIKKNY